MIWKNPKALTAITLLLLTSAVHAQATDPDPQLKPNPTVSMRDFEPPANMPYVLGPGDAISVDAPGRPELTGKHTLGPDGSISVPIAGTIMLSGLTRDQAAGAIEHALDPYYTDPVVSVSVERYVANQIIVLGAVTRPGIVTFQDQPTLLEAIVRANSGSSESGGGDVSGGGSGGGGGDTGGGAGGGGGGGGGGGLPGVRNSNIPDEVSIYRGTDQMLSVHLRQLVEAGSPLANMRLRRGDLIYVSGKTSYVSVLGQVYRTGNLRLEPGSRLEDLIAQAGGPTEKAGRNPSIEIIHQNGPNGPSTTRTIEFNTLLHHKSVDYTIQSGDVIYVPESGFNRLSFTMQALAPLVNLFTVASLVGGGSNSSF